MENTSRYFYKALYTGMSETQYRSSKQYFSIARKVKEIGLFEIKRPIFARYTYYRLFKVVRTGTSLTLVLNLRHNLWLPSQIGILTRLITSMNNSLPTNQNLAVIGPIGSLWW